MPKWNPPAPEHARSVTHRIIRVPAKGRLCGIVTSPEPLATNTHYIAHRTIPCEGPGECRHCEEGHSWRYHLYIGILITPGLEHAILELTAAASDTIRNYYQLHAETRGALLSACRPSGRHNGRVAVTCHPPKDHNQALPEPLNLMRLLCHIWGIKYDPVDDIARCTLRGVPFVTPPTGNGDNH